MSPHTGTYGYGLTHVSSIHAYSTYLYIDKKNLKEKFQIFACWHNIIKHSFLNTIVSIVVQSEKMHLNFP